MFAHSWSASTVLNTTGSCDGDAMHGVPPACVENAVHGVPSACDGDAVHGVPPAFVEDAVHGVPSACDRMASHGVPPACNGDVVRSVPSACDIPEIHNAHTGALIHTHGISFFLGEKIADTRIRFITTQEGITLQDCRPTYSYSPSHAHSTHSRHMEWGRTSFSRYTYLQQPVLLLLESLPLGGYPSHRHHQGVESCPEKSGT
jgi:hypothetical protein